MDISTDEAMRALYAVLLLVLVGSSLIMRRLPLGHVLRLALIWVAIFAVLLGLFTWAKEQGYIAGDALMEAEIQSPPLPPTARTVGQALRIPVAADGHYWIEATINGTPARFLIDSGASVTALSEATARAAGLNIDSSGQGVTMLTANGRVTARQSNIATLAVGPIRASDLPVVVSPAFGEVNVIGMNLLSRLGSWGVRDREMVLTP